MGEIWLLLLALEAKTRPASGSMNQFGSPLLTYFLNKQNGLKWSPMTSSDAETDSKPIIIIIIKIVTLTLNILVNILYLLLLL